MQLREKMTDLQIELKRERRREQDAAATRLMACLRAAFGSELEDRLQALSTRLLNESATDADRKLLKSLPGDDLHLIGSTGPQWIVLIATVYAAY